MKLHRSLGGLAAAFALVVGCTETHDPTGPQGTATPLKAGSGSPVVAAATTVVLNGYDVIYDGRTFDGTNTTFAYTVRANGAQHALSNFVIQLPSCAPALAGSSPSGGSVGPDPNSGLFGIKWNLSIGSGDTVGRRYSVTYPGDIVEGLVRVAVKASTASVLGVLPGACQGFDVAGFVFVDQDGDGVRDLSNEPGVVADVTVAIVNPDGSSETTKTDANGRYAFRRLDGTYTLRVDLVTAADDFNDKLCASFDATTPLTTTATVGPDSPDNNFGFDPQSQKIENDIVTGVIFTNGEDAKFWKQELRAASKGNSGNTTFDAPTLLGFLSQIEALFFEDPYQFTDGSELSEALAILSDNSNASLPMLLSELFVTQLNHVSGLGLAEELDLQAVLISWGESLIIDRSAAGSQIRPLRRPNSDDELDTATDMFKAINEGRGGGDVPDPGGG